MSCLEWGLAPTRSAARQLVNHKHIELNGIVTNIASCHVRPGDLISIRGKSQSLAVIEHSIATRTEVRKFPWIEWNGEKREGKYLEYPEREQIPENINEQLIVELYSK